MRRAPFGTLTVLAGLLLAPSTPALETASAPRPAGTPPAGSTTTYAWGPNLDGTLGNGARGGSGGVLAEVQATPQPVLGLSVARAVAARAATYAVGNDGTLWAWGSNYHGLLGIGSPNGQLVQVSPVRIAGVTDIVQVVAGTSSALARRRDGTVWTWGWNPRGKLGDGTWLDRDAPVQVQGLSEVVAIASSTASYALRQDGTVWTWGFDVHKLGPRYSHLIYSALTEPVALPWVDGVQALACGANHCFAIRHDGSLIAWGSNLNGELGIGGYGTPSDEPVQPTPVPGLSGVVAVAPGRGHTLALLGDGALASWGRNDLGQLGDGTSASRSTAGPVAVPGKLVQVAAGDGISLALGADGTVWSWGNNKGGALGNGAVSDQPNPWPAPVPGLASVISIAADFTAYAVSSDGSPALPHHLPRRHLTSTGPR